MHLFKENEISDGSNETEFQTTPINSVSDLDSCPKTSIKIQKSNQILIKDKVCKNLSPKRKKYRSQLRAQKSSRRWSLQPPKVESIEFIELDDRALMKNILDALREKGEAKTLNGDYLGAVTAFNDALTIQRQFFDRYDNLASTGSILNEIGIVLSQLGDDFQTLALNSLDKAIEIRQNTLGTGDEKTSDSVHNLWILLHNIKDRYMNEDNQLNYFR